MYVQIQSKEESHEENSEYTSPPTPRSNKYFYKYKYKYDLDQNSENCLHYEKNINLEFTLYFLNHNLHFYFCFVLFRKTNSLFV